MIFALACVPLIVAIGCAVDYSAAMRMQAKLQASTDSASVGAIGSQSPGYLAAETMTSDGPVPAAVTSATGLVQGNMSTITGYSNLVLSVSVTKSGLNLNSSVQARATVPTTFMGIIGFNSLTVTASSTAAVMLPGYLDFYLMLDVSGSMGLPSTDSEESRLAAINPDDFILYPNGCTFACHFSAPGNCLFWQKYFTGGVCMGYALSRTAGNPWNLPVSACSTPGTSACIQLRADAVGYAVQQLLQTANTSELVANQYRVGLYPFIQYLYPYFPLTSSISGSATNPSTINYAAANLANLLDTGTNPNLGSGGTHFENAFPTINSMIVNVGNGSSWNNTAPFVFLVTDGAQNNQMQWNEIWSGNNNATVIDPSLCTPLKNRGITVAVLYIPYQPIQNPTNFSNNEDFAVNAIIPNIPAALQACASPNFFFTANSPADITAALAAMFNQAVAAARITN